LRTKQTLPKAGFVVLGIHGEPCWIITHYRELKMLALEFLLIRQAHVVHGYTLKEITAHLGLHYSTAGKAFARAEQES
jgi:hypothetical protein